MNTDTRFPIWLWLLGWIVTSFALYQSTGTELLANAWDYIFISLVSLAMWPVILGIFIGDVWMYVHP